MPVVIQLVLCTITSTIYVPNQPKKITYAYPHNSPKRYNMRVALVFLTVFAASVVAAPVPISLSSPIEAPGSLMVREANEGTSSTGLDGIKRQVFENLDTIIEARAISLGVKRRPVQLGTEEEEGNAKDKLRTKEDAADKRGLGDSHVSNGLKEIED